MPSSVISDSALQVDVILIHFNHCGRRGSVADTWKALKEAKAAGKTRAIGVSHFLKPDLQELLPDVPSVNQCSYSVEEHDDETIAYCKSQNITCGAFLLHDVPRTKRYLMKLHVNIGTWHTLLCAAVPTALPAQCAYVLAGAAI